MIMQPVSRLGKEDDCNLAWSVSPVFGTMHETDLWKVRENLWADLWDYIRSVRSATLGPLKEEGQGSESVVEFTRTLDSGKWSH
jgi:hypothetical protein